MLCWLCAEVLWNLTLCDVARLALLRLHGHTPARSVPHNLLPLISFGTLSGHLAEGVRSGVPRAHVEFPAVQRVRKPSLFHALKVREHPVAWVFALTGFFVVHGRSVGLRTAELMLEPTVFSDDAGVVPAAVLKQGKHAGRHASWQTRYAPALYLLLVENVTLRTPMHVSFPELVTQEEAFFVVEVPVENFLLATHARLRQSWVTDAAAKGLVFIVTEISASTRRGICFAVDAVHQRFAVGAHVLVGGVSADGVQGRHVNLYSISEP